LDMSDRFKEDRRLGDGEDYKLTNHLYSDGHVEERYDGLGVISGASTALNLNMIEYKLPVSSKRHFDKKSSERETITHAELSSLRRLAVFVVPTNVEPPISDEEIQQLGRTPAEDILNRQVIDRITGTVRGFRTIPQAPEFVAVIEAAKGFVAGQESLVKMYEWSRASSLCVLVLDERHYLKLHRIMVKKK
jgi:hypothetical protein